MQVFDRFRRFRAAFLFMDAEGLAEALLGLTVDSLGAIDDSKLAQNVGCLDVLLAVYLLVQRLGFLDRRKGFLRPAVPVTGDAEAMDTPSHPERIGMSQRRFNPDGLLHYLFDGREMVPVGEDFRQRVQAQDVAGAIG